MPKNNDEFNKDNNNQPDEIVDPIDQNESVVSSDDITAASEVESAHSDDLVDESDLDETQEIISTLTADLQRTRADFENYQKRTAQEKVVVRNMAVRDTVSKLLPTIDIIEQASAHIPAEVIDTPFGKGMASIDKKLAKQLKDLGVEKIDSNPGDEFNPELHNAIQVDEDAEGETEVIAEVLQSGYKKDGEVVRYTMVKVTRK